MRKILLLFLAVTSTCFSIPSLDFLQQKINYNLFGIIASVFNPTVIPYKQADFQADSLDEIKAMLQKEGHALNSAVINKVLTTLKCATEYNVDHNHILTIIDYSLPSSEKRLWIFDLNEKKLLFHTYVSHGINSGKLLSNYFSNKYNSKASSIGVYETEKAYYGREGLSLQLTGLDKNFNDNAASRAIVMHPGWYVEEEFIKKYGRAGRSWGCPALPKNLSESIINTIKDKSLLVIYYPSDHWFSKSKFLNCDSISTLENSPKLITELIPDEDSIPKEEILFVDLNKNNKREENEPILAITADNYERLFQTKAPLARMLRRQINHTEYVALNEAEFKLLLQTNSIVLNTNKDDLNAVYFVIPEVKMQRGYYQTHMKIIVLDKTKDVRLDSTTIVDNNEETKSYHIHFDANSSISLKSTKQFIRWLGL